MGKEGGVRADRPTINHAPLFSGLRWGSLGLPFSHTTPEQLQRETCGSVAELNAFLQSHPTLFPPLCNSIKEMRGAFPSLHWPRAAKGRWKGKFVISPGEQAQSPLHFESHSSWHIQTSCQALQANLGKSQVIEKKLGVWSAQLSEVLSVTSSGSIRQLVTALSPRGKSGVLTRSH